MRTFLFIIVTAIFTVVLMSVVSVATWQYWVIFFMWVFSSLIDVAIISLTKE
jgi:hypothetical protein